MICATIMVAAQLGRVIALGIAMERLAQALVWLVRLGDFAVAVSASGRMRLGHLQLTEGARRFQRF